MVEGKHPRIDWLAGQATLYTGENPVKEPQMLLVGVRFPCAPGTGFAMGDESWVKVQDLQRV